MGWYLRKALSAGPLRLNLSRSGLGLSVGVKGARLGIGPRGTYVHLGRGGIYYRKTLGPPGSRPPALSKPTVGGQPEMVSLESAPADTMAPASSASLLSELNRVHKRTSLLPFALIAALFLVAAALYHPLLGVIGVLLGIPLILYARHADVTNGTALVFYDLQSDALDRFNAFSRSFRAFCSAKYVWHIDSQGRTGDWKRHAGADTLVKRITVLPRLGHPPRVVSNLEIPMLPSGRQTFYFFPDQLLVYEPGAVGAVRYQALNISLTSTRFREDEDVPADAKFIGKTWRYVNKAGGPDRRFSNNREIPIALYAEVHLTSPSGLNGLYLCSSIPAAQAFTEGLRALSAPTRNVPPGREGSAADVPRPTHVWVRPPSEEARPSPLQENQPDEPGVSPSSASESVSPESLSMHRADVLARTAALANKAESWTPPAGENGNGTTPKSSAPGPEGPGAAASRSRRAPLVVILVTAAFALAATGAYVLSRHSANDIPLAAGTRVSVPAPPIRGATPASTQGAAASSATPSRDSTPSPTQEAAPTPPAPSRASGASPRATRSTRSSTLSESVTAAIRSPTQPTPIPAPQQPTLQAARPPQPPLPAEYNVGLNAAKANDWLGAERAYRDALQKSPSNPEIWYKLGVALGQQKRRPDAIAAYQEALRLNRDHAYSWYNLGLELSRQRDYHAALAAFREVTRLELTNAHGWKIRGDLHIINKEYLQAISALEEAIRLKPDDADIWYNLGAAHALSNNAQAATEVYERLKRLDPAKARQFHKEVLLAGTTAAPAPAEREQ